MKIELKNLKISASLSEETTAYTAIVSVDGKPAFDARNQGHGGCDLIRPLGDLSVETVDAWLAVNVAPSGPYEPDPAKREPYDTGKACDLESFIGREIGRVEAEKEWRRVTTKVALLAEGQIRTYSKTKFPPTEANLARIREQIASGKIKGELINGAGEDVVARAKRAFGLDTEGDSVMERYRTNRLTAADARYLAARERAQGEGDELMIAALETLAGEQEARYAEFQRQRDERVAAEREVREAPLPERFILSDGSRPSSKIITDTASGKALEVGLCDLAGARQALAAFAA